MSNFARTATRIAKLIEDYGGPVTISREQGEYDETARRHLPAAPLEQQLNARLETPDLGNGRLPDSFTRKFERIAYCAPQALSGTSFEPAVGDLLTEARSWRVGATETIAVKGVVLVHVLGLDAA